MTISILHPDLQKNGNDIHDHVMGAPVCDAASWLNMTTSALPGRPRANHMVVLVVNFMGVNCPETSGTVLCPASGNPTVLFTDRTSKGLSYLFTFYCYRSIPLNKMSNKARLWVEFSQGEGSVSFGYTEVCND